MNALGTVRRRMFGIPSARSVFRREGFSWDAWDKFSHVAESLMTGYHATLERTDLSEVAEALELVDAPDRGFAYEGAGMGLAALDAVAPWKNRVNAFTNGPASHHLYPFYVGVGLAYARMRKRPETALSRLHPTLGWVIGDGFGFHEAFFHRRATIDRQIAPSRLSDYGRRMFDQGVGRALWFSSGADPEMTAETIEAYDPTRRSDLWGGVGLASAYGGGTDSAGLSYLRERAGSAAPRLAVGAAIAAWGREQAHNQTEHTDRACQAYAGISADAAAAAVGRASQHLPATLAEPVHETWTQRILLGIDPDAAVTHIAPSIPDHTSGA